MTTPAPQPTTKIIPTITDAGLAAAIRADSLGLAAEVTHVAFGDHGRVVDPSETELTNEIARVPVADGFRIDPHQININALLDDDSEFWIKEVSFHLSDGVAVAIWSSETPLTFKSSVVPLLVGFDLKLAAFPANSVTVVSTGANLALGAWMEQFVAVAAASISNMARHVQLLFDVNDAESNINVLNAEIDSLNTEMKQKNDEITALNQQSSDAKAALTAANTQIEIGKQNTTEKLAICAASSIENMSRFAELLFRISEIEQKV